MSNDAQPSANLFAAQQHMLRERLRLLLATLHPALHDDVVRSLQDGGKLLARPRAEDVPQSNALPAGAWPLLTLLVAQYFAPGINSEYAGDVAVAVECFVCALDLLDDIEDDDQTPIVQALGAARVLNVSTTLLMLVQRVLLSLSKQGIAPILILRLLDTLQESALVATSGQHRDLLAEQRPAHDLTREECIEIAAAKAGSIMRLACRLGALCAGADELQCEQFSELGELLGIAHQLDNDSHDLYYLIQSASPALLSTEAGKAATRSVKSDVVRGKKTLPVVLAAKMGKPLHRTLGSSDEEKEPGMQALREAVITTWGTCLLYRERARDRLQEIEAKKPLAPALRLLLGF